MPSQYSRSCATDRISIGVCSRTAYAKISDPHRHGWKSWIRPASAPPLPRQNYSPENVLSSRRSHILWPSRALRELALADSRSNSASLCLRMFVGSRDGVTRTSFSCEQFRRARAGGVPASRDFHVRHFIRRSMALRSVDDDGNPNGKWRDGRQYASRAEAHDRAWAKGPTRAAT
jgi:hypothetical protein